jgi:CRP-like cAMP-binding protein
MSVPLKPRNRILGSLSPPDYSSFGASLDLVDLPIKQVLFDVDEPIEHVYFPEDSVASMLGVMSDGTAVETATVGREGMVGLAVFLGTDQTSAQAIIQVPGTALRMTADDFRQHVPNFPELSRSLQLYTQALFTFVAQSSACNRIHTVNQRCARWILHTRERIGEDTFPLTHQFLSQMLGVRRATVTDAMQSLHEAGGLQYDRGVVTLLDRRTLEREACECYGIVTREFERLLNIGWSAGENRPGPGPMAERGISTIGDGASGNSAND